MNDPGAQVVFIRHGITSWNVSGRIQGRTDVPLSEEGRRIVRTWSIPTQFERVRWFSSPLRRAVETANLLGCDSPEIETSLLEMHWGEWEGMTLEQLRLDVGMQSNEDRGLDFTPANGESPRQVRQRVGSWLQVVGSTRQTCVAVTHKGVIRAALSLATGWDMKDQPPYRLRWDHAHVFDIDPLGSIEVHQVNVPMTGD